MGRRLTALPLVTGIYGHLCSLFSCSILFFRQNNIESSHSLLRDHVHVPSWLLVAGEVSNLGQRWQQWPPRQGGCEPGSHLARQPGSHPLQWSPSSSQEEPIIQERYQTMNHLRQSSHPLLFLLPLARSPAGRPANCSLPSTSLMNDYCIF